MERKNDKKRYDGGGYRGSDYADGDETDPSGHEDGAHDGDELDLRDADEETRGLSGPSADEVSESEGPEWDTIDSVKRKALSKIRRFLDADDDGQ
jgi:hypothetical protein